MENLKAHTGAIVGSAASWFGVIVANRETITFWLQSVSYVAAIVVSGFTIWSLVKRNKK